MPPRFQSRTLCVPKIRLGSQRCDVLEPAAPRAEFVGSGHRREGAIRLLASPAYWLLRRLLELVVLRLRSERSKELEILVLRASSRTPRSRTAPARSFSAGSGGTSQPGTRFRPGQARHSVPPCRSGRRAAGSRAGRRPAATRS